MPKKPVPKLILVKNQEPDSPNIFLNVGRLSSPTELWIVALTSILIQVGVLLYSGFITYYPALMYKKDNDPIQSYAYPCTATGTLFLVFGLIICSHVVESSTVEKTYRPKGMEARMVWLQKQGVVNDQSFGSFAIFANEAKSAITTSRRADVDPILEIKAVLGTTITLCGYVVQFVGLRGMHWSATVVQLGATLAMAALRAFVRKDLITKITALKLPQGFELDWFATNLALRLFRGESNAGSHATSKERDGTEPTDWLIPLKANAGRKENLLSFQVIDSMAHHAIRLRESLADLATWPRLASAQARATALAIESTMNSLNPLFQPTSSQPSSTEHLLSESSRDAFLDDKFYFDVELSKEQKISFYMEQKASKWKAPENAIEAALSLWYFAAQSSPTNSVKSQIATPLSVDTSSSRIMLLLDRNSGRLRRDLGWWMPNDLTRFVTVREETQEKLSEHPRILGCGHTPCSPGWNNELPYTYKDLPRSHNITDSYTCRNTYIGVELDKASGLLFAQYIFTAFMQAASGILKRPVEGRANIQVTDLSQPDPATSWRSVTLQNTQLSRIAQDIHLTGLCSLEDAFLCIIPPLSAKSRLPHLASVIEWACKYATKHEQVGRWKEASQVYVWLLRIFPKDGSTHIESMTVVLAFVVSLSLERERRDAHKHQSDDFPDLLKLREKLEYELQATNPKLVAKILRAWEIDGPEWISDAILALKIARRKDRGGTDRQDDTTEYIKSMIKSPESLHTKDFLHRTVLHYAAMKQAPPITMLLAKGIDINAQDIFGLTPLHLCCLNHWSFSAEIFNPHSFCFRARRKRSGSRTQYVEKCWPENVFEFLRGWPTTHRSDVSELIHAGANIKIKARDGMTALHFAAIRGHVRTVTELIDAGADPNASDHLGYTALDWAVLQGNIKVMDQLLPLVNQTATRRRTVLHGASVGGDRKIMQTIVDHRPSEIAAVDQYGMTPLHVSAVCGNEEASLFLLDKLKNDGYRLQDMDRTGMRPIDYAAIEGYGDLASTLFLEMDVDVEMKNWDDALLLYHAAAGDCGDLIQQSITSQYPGPIKQHRHKSVLHEAAEFGSLSAIKALLEAGADIAATNSDGCSPLHVAASHGRTSCVQHFIDAGVAVNQLTRSGSVRYSCESTSLQLAVANGHVEVARLLINRGASTDVDIYGRTILHYSVEGGQVSSAEFILGLGPEQEETKLNAETIEGDQPLTNAARACDVDMVQFLLDKGAKTEHTNKAGNTALLVVVEEGIHSSRYWSKDGKWSRDKYWSARLKIIRCLVENGANVRARNHRGRTAISALQEYVNDDTSAGNLSMEAQMATRNGRELLLEYLQDQELSTFFNK